MEKEKDLVCIDVDEESEERWDGLKGMDCQEWFEREGERLDCVFMRVRMKRAVREGNGSKKDAFDKGRTALGKFYSRRGLDSKGGSVGGEDEEGEKRTEEV